MEASSSPAAGAGFVTSSFEDGYVILVEQGQALSDGVRVVWSKGDREQRRAVAPGRYQVRRYVISRRDKEGVEWNVWATGLGREVEVRAGAETRIELDPDVTVKTHFMWAGAKVGLGGGFKGDSGMGLSLVRDEARVALPFQVSSAGRVNGTGEGAYG